MSISGSTKLPAKFYDGIKPIPVAATLMLSGPMAHVVGYTVARQYAVDRLRVSPRVSRSDRFVTLPDGAQLQCADSALLDRLPQEGTAEGLVAWLEQRWWVALTCLTVMISGILSGYFIGLPIAAEKISARVPLEYERGIGEKALAWLDEKQIFQPSGLDPEVRQTVERDFTQLHRGLPFNAYYRLEFRRSPAIGPNAFALPGGVIVITDEMILLTESSDEVQAVLAHEIGHVELRHALRSVLQNSAVAALTAALANDASSLSLAVSSLPAILAQTKYSRQFESDADDYAFRLLKQHDLSPVLFASVMERLSEKTHGKEQGWSFVSTHPVTSERIARARQAAQ